MEKTKIGERKSRSSAGRKPSCVSPAASCGPDEAGEWEFWTSSDLSAAATSAAAAREPIPASAGAAWIAKGYEKLTAWATSSAQYMRPASAAEVEVGLNKNDKDARFVEAVEVDGQEMAIAAKYRLRPK